MSVRFRTGCSLNSKRNQQKQIGKFQSKIMILLVFVCNQHEKATLRTLHEHIQGAAEDHIRTENKKFWVLLKIYWWLKYQDEVQY